MKSIILIIMLVMSIVAFCAMGIDKKKAQKGKWRIKEWTLFVFALLGGGVGGTLGMLVFRHKTKHWYFKLGFPLIAVIQVAAYLYFFLIR